MKTKCMNGCRFLLIGAIVMAGIFIIRPSVAQNTPGKDSKKQQTVKIKVVTDQDGKTTTIDTMITRSGPMDPEEIREMMIELKKQMRELQRNLRGMDRELAMVVLDSLDMDSLDRQVKKIVIKGHGGRGGEFMMEGFPEGFDYNFGFDSEDFLCPPPPPCRGRCCEAPPALHLRGLPLKERRIMRGLRDEGGSSLNDLLGDIPMERVKNYSIKEYKGGKKIIIDVEDGPVYTTKNKTIIIDRQVP